MPRVSEHMTNDPLSCTFGIRRDPLLLTSLSKSQVHEDPKKIQIKAKMQYKLAFQGQTLYIARAGDFGVISIKWP